LVRQRELIRVPPRVGVVLRLCSIDRDVFV
jgi:hypothetical protein